MSDLLHSTRTIKDFRTKLLGGGARSNLFEVEIEYPSFGAEASSDSGGDGTGPKETGKFLIKAAEIPAANLGNIPVPFRGRVLPVAGDRTFDPWTVTIINDTDFVIRDAMERWSNSINDIQTAQGTINPETYQLQQQRLYLPFISSLVTIDYGNFKRIDENIVPTSVRISSIRGSNVVSINLDYSQYDFPENLTFPMDIPDGYKLKTLDEIFN